MSILDLHAPEMVSASQNALTIDPPKPPTKFSGWAFATAAPRGVVAGVAQSQGFVADVLGAFGQVEAATGAYSAGGMFSTLSSDERKQSEDAAKQMRQGLSFSSEAGDLVRSAANFYAPDAQTAHVSERLLFDAARVMTKAVGYSVAGGPVVGSVLTGADEGLTAADELRLQGVDEATRTKVGAIAGLGAGVGIALPVAGSTALKTAALVAAGGPGAFVAQQAAVRKVLQGAGYDQISEQYDPLDPVGLAVATLIPAAFGAHALRGRTRAAKSAADEAQAIDVPRASDEQVDAARTVLMVEERNRASPFKDDDFRAQETHAAAFSRATEQMAAGERVSVTDMIARPDLEQSRAILEQVETLQAERAELLPAAADLAERGAIRAAREELALLEQQRPDTTDAGIRSLAKDLQSDGISYKEALAQASKQQADALAEFNARQQRLEVAIERNAKAQQATQRIGELDKRIAELEQQLGPEARLATFERDINRAVAAVGQEIEQARQRMPKRTQPKEEDVATQQRTPTQSQAVDTGNPSAAIEAIQPPGERARPTEAASGLVDDAAAARIQELELERPDLMVQMDGMDEPRRLSDLMKSVKEEADDLLAEGDLMQVAAQCALLNGA